MNANKYVIPKGRHLYDTIDEFGYTKTLKALANLFLEDKITFKQLRAYYTVVIKDYRVAYGRNFPIFFTTWFKEIRA
jgi:hypothetical protein